MDQLTNQRIKQQHSSPSMIHQSPYYNVSAQQRTFTDGHTRPEIGHNQRDHFPSPNFYLHSGPFPHLRPALYPHDMHQVIQRDIEKQRIREEIMFEMARRRELEAEVRRELMMETELALRTGIPLGLSPAVMGFNSPTRLAITGSPLEERISLSIEERMRRENKALETMPFQRGKNANLRISGVEPVLEQGEEKKKIILLAKPDTNTSGSKRKAETPPAIDASDEPPPVLILKKKAKEEWTCSLCQISATSELGLNEHLQGKKHKSKEATSRTNRNGKNYAIGLLSNKSTQSTQVASEPLKNEPEVTVRLQKNGGQEEKKYRHWCEICQVGTHSKKVMKHHKEGKSHLKRMSKNMLKVETITNEAEEVDGRREDVISEKVEETLDGAGLEHHRAEDRFEPDCGVKKDHGSGSEKTEAETKAEVCGVMGLTKPLDVLTSDVVLMDNIKDDVAGNISKPNAVPENGTKAKDYVARDVSKPVDVADEASPKNATEAEDDVARNLHKQEDVDVDVDVARDICESEVVNEQSPGDGSK